MSISTKRNSVENSASEAGNKQQPQHDDRTNRSRTLPPAPSSSHYVILVDIWLKKMLSVRPISKFVRCQSDQNADNQRGKPVTIKRWEG